MISSRETFKYKMKQLKIENTNKYLLVPKRCRKCNNIIPYEKRKNSFCSHSCAGTYNNLIRGYKKPLLDRFCKRCNKKIERKTHRDTSTLCKECRKGYFFNDDIPLKSIIYTKHHKSSAFALVRSRARTIAKDLNMTKCSLCGYNKHVEVCHKKAISSFSEDTLVSIINSPDNLIALCPNCHWEFDNH